MEISQHQNERLHSAINQLRRTPEFAFLRQMIVAEGAKDEPDYQGLKAHMLSLIELGMQHEIEGVKEMRVKRAVAP